jgi:hypothetical protein
MKHAVIALAAFLAVATGFAQEKTDTVKVGNFVIIKKNASGSDSRETRIQNDDKTINIKINTDKKRKKRNLSTNWWILDLGFANYRDQTNYGTAVPGNAYFRQLSPAAGAVNNNSYRLNTGKSSNVNLWFFMQKLNVASHVLNLKYGAGLEMYNFRYDSRISYRKDINNMPYVFNDTVSFEKNKLYAGYLTIPVMLNIDFTPNNRKGFSISAGVSAGYLIASRNKQVSGERGKQKFKQDFDMEPWRLAAIAEVGLGPVRLYGSYSLNTLQKNNTRLEQYPYAVGVRFSNW